MHIQDLSVVNYKNLTEANLRFSAKLNCFIGDNGAGKTNLLDSVYYLSFCKSFFSPADLLNIKHEENFFMLKGKYMRLESEESIHCSLQKGNKKQFKRNSKTYTKLADHIGLIPLVMISPSDSALIRGGSDERRKFTDGVISQFNHEYLNNLLSYNRALVQRNILLKQFASGKSFDPEILDVWDLQLIDYGKRIHEERKKFIEKLIPVFQRYYSLISMGNEQVGLVHQSDYYEGDFETVFKNAVSRDRMLQYTSIGIHKEDLLLNIGDYPIRKLGSQGQIKTYLVALKLAQFEFLKEISGIKPILLLDDIFDKLDKNRVEEIIKLVSNDHFGQIFITDTNREHLDGIIKSAGADYKIFRVKKGMVFDEEE
ncbi:MAG: DNA replication/repair protein RecF [Prolixibacteraceae bacterium]|nr:DNA replication/repair protein RecF [Prolixibacteraceae bacterium]MBN2772823.1 DNA replication/repair protein RecF [Prolixibacteraceae bacterium]